MSEKELPKTRFAVIDSITSVNHKPHPYTIGAKHVAHASKYSSGILDESVMREIQCAFPRCSFSFDEHKSDRVAFVKFIDECTAQEANEWLKTLVDSGWCKEEKVDGFAFIETGIRPK